MLGQFEQKTYSNYKLLKSLCTDKVEHVFPFSPVLIIQIKKVLLNKRFAVILTLLQTEHFTDEQERQLTALEINLGILK